MDGRMGDIQKERMRRVVRVYDANRFVANDIGGVLAVQVVGNIHISANVEAPRRALVGGVIVIVMVARPISDVAVEASVQWRVLALEVTQVPFADAMVHVAYKTATNLYTFCQYVCVGHKNSATTRT